MHYGTLLLWGLLLGLAACDPSSRSVSTVVSTPLDSGSSVVSDGGIVDGGLLVPAVLGPQWLAFHGEVFLLDGGTQPFSVNAEDAQLETGKTDKLVLHFSSRLVDYRVRLFDGSDSIVVSDDHEVVLNGGGLDYQIGLQTPLKPGRSYLLAIDAQMHAAVSDAQGKLFKDCRLPIHVSGEPEPEPAVKTKKRRRSR
ncbi:MAG: hypothetical protein K1X64_08915 [Myxococcaceae bacterium]|nr:hypothetical protein [Myxococcaceae bacterium]